MSRKKGTLAAAQEQWTWQHFQGIFPPEILQAPRVHWEAVGWRSIRYLARTAVGTPWMGHLALVAVVLSSYTKMTPGSVYLYLHTLQRGWRTIFAAYGLSSMQEWQPEEHLPRYLEDAALPATLATRQEFLGAYFQVATHIEEYLSTLPSPQRAIYHPFGLPRLSSVVFRQLTRREELEERQRQKRKRLTDAVTPHFHQIRYEAHLRWNELWRLYTHFQQLEALINTGEEEPPVAFVVEEPRWGRLRFILWDRPSFGEAHRQRYGLGPRKELKARRGTFAPERNHYFLEFIGCDPVQDPRAPSDPAGLFWFGDLLKEDVLGKNGTLGTQEEVARKQAYLRSWGYGKETSAQKLLRPFDAPVAGLLTWEFSRALFIRSAQERTEGVLVPMEGLIAAATFGLAALDVFTTTGARLNELLQISLTPECLHTMQVDGEDRLILRLVPKGEDRPADFFVGEETHEVFLKVVRLLWEHYHLHEGDPLPRVPFHNWHTRAEQFPARSYLFQFSGSHLPDQAITACLHFVLHGMIFQTKDGQTVPISSHILRHAFATHLRQVEKLPLDIVAIILHHKNLQTTAYYGAATQQQVASQPVSFLDRIATPLGSLKEFAARAPEELREQLEEAQQRAGTLMRVPGGRCTCHAQCPIGYACDGCLYKVVDPTYREDLLEHRSYAEQGLAMAEKRRHGPDIIRYRAWIQRIDAELEEMRLIEEYRSDEHRPSLLKIQRRPKQGASLAPSTLRSQATADRAVGPVYRRSTGGAK